MGKYRIENYNHIYSFLDGVGKCVVCGDEFKCKFNNGRAKYCSLECKGAMAKLRSKEKAKKHRLSFKTCSICGEPIEQVKKGKIRRYCSNKCKQRSFRLKKTNVSA
jgi:endogenous inhibitor of DNA gyrase (YacG/DUF329 family)